jgi:hypothetical protein
MRTAVRLRAITVAALVASACARNPKPDEDQSVYVRPDPIAVHVKNENFLDMNVGVVASGVRRRLGQVSGNSTANFTIAWSVANGQQISMTATPIGGSGAPFTSGPLTVQPGQSIEMRVGSVLRQSNAVVRASP